MTRPGQRAMLLLLSIVLAVAGFAQSRSHSIQGSVTDKRGNLLPKSVVHLKNMSTLEIQSYVIQEDGLFHFKGLNSDTDFEIHAEYRGKLSKISILSRFDSEKQTPIKLVIPVE